MMVLRSTIFVVLIALLSSLSMAQQSTPGMLTVKHIAKDFNIANLDAAPWNKARPVEITTYWSGETAPITRYFTARLLWSDTALYVRFDARQHESLVVSEKPDLTKKTRGLWDRDVCEIFIAPDKTRPNKYFEFEIAPTGEWIDLGIEVMPDERVTDWDYSSKMECAARDDLNDGVVMAIKIPFSSLGKTPKANDVWLGNLFRCIGKDPTRGYLSWQPTKTPKPNFHVPGAFGEFQFRK